ncbi:LexA family transcriptional regulator [Acinetobacter indicus]|uniref:LexA family transcriptional regulator n=1 Tax=Acinetobacter indicus TaxID=756892 RepID=UPI000CECC39B|nr:LexA family transcriptional regulator [Acinetobacter indicus]
MDISEIRMANLLHAINTYANGSQKDFAEKVGTSPAYLSQIINKTLGKSGKPATVGNALARKIETAFELERGWMDLVHRHDEQKKAVNAQLNDLFLMKNVLEGRRSKNIDLTKNPFSETLLIPLISWHLAKEWIDQDTSLQGHHVYEWHPANQKCGENGYVLSVQGHSMAPKFEPGDRIYVKPNIQTDELKTDDFVIVSCAGDDEPSFKKLIIEGKDCYLQPINPNWPDQIAKLTDDCKIIGKVVGMYRKI